MGLAVRLLAPVPGSWFAMFVGSFAGGFAFFTLVLVSGPGQGPIGVLGPILGGVGGAWAAGTIGSLGWGLAALLVRLRP